MWEEAVLAIDGNTPTFNASQETPPGVVCRTDRSTGVGLTKYRSSYLYCDFIKYHTVLKISVPPSSIQPGIEILCVIQSC